MSLYERLGLSKEADSQEIRKAYLKLSRSQHPDKGGDEDKFKRLQEAYEILSDDDKRSFYDQTGQIPGSEVQGPGHGMSGMHGMPFQFPFDIGAMFSGMFPGGHGHGHGQGQTQTKRQKGPPKIHEFGLTLKDFFYGKRVQMKFERQKFCTQCHGEGAEQFENCNSCRGNGFREEIRMLGPGMQVMARSPCGSCSSSGRQPVKPCSKCNGVKFTKQEKVLNVTIEPGAKPGDVMNFPKECSDNHDYLEPGDVHIVLREADESGNFMRMEDDLSITCDITLVEGLIGTQKVLQGHPAHPGGLTITVPPGTIRADVVTIAGEGMPCVGNTTRGNLMVNITMDVTNAEKDLLIKNHEALKALLR